MFYSCLHINIFLFKEILKETCIKVQLIFCPFF